MKSIKIARRVSVAFMTSMLVAVLLIAFATPISAQTGNTNAQEVGDAIYRHLPILFVIDEAHAGIYCGYVEGDPSNRHNHGIIHISGSGATVQYARMDEFIAGREYYGAYTVSTNGKLNSSTRQAINNTANALVSAGIGYVGCNPYPSDILEPDWDGGLWDGTVQDIAAIRCDGVVEYSYEANGVMVWGKNQQAGHYDITQLVTQVNYGKGWNLYEHNDLTLLGLDPSDELTPNVQRGALGLQFTNMRASSPENPTPVSNLHSPSHYDAIGQCNDLQSRDNTIEVAWTDATDVQSGLWGYYTKWDHQPNTEPTWEDTKINPGVETNTSQEVEDGDDWYFHIRSVDNAGNWDDSTAHLGPFYICTPPPFLTFTIQEAGQTGTLTLYDADDTEIGSWDAKSGDNKPDHEYVDSKGPIPHSSPHKPWSVGKWEPWKKHGCFPINDRETLNCTRDKILIHAWGKTSGCIAVKNFEGFKDTLEKYWPKGVDAINLEVSYLVTAYRCDPEPECCDGGKPNKCCDKGPNKGKKDYCPENKKPETGCCQYGDGKCYDNKGKKWSPDECEECYGGTWRSGWRCEDGECVPEASTQPPSLTFTIQTAGQPGTLSLTYYEDGVKKTEDWSADSGYKGLKNKPDYECVKDGGPIPHGTWDVYRKGWVSDRREDYPIQGGRTLACGRNEIFIHDWGETIGCIAVRNYESFTKTLEEYWPKNVDTIDLFVKYPDTAYECGKDKKGFGKGKCCDEGPDKRDEEGRCQNGYCPENKEKGCCQYCDGCYDGNRDPEECRVCFGGEWHSDWWCEEDECVPEASTFVVVAVGLLFLAGYVRLLKRKPE